ncbi:hypothetical protein Agub_g783, partial [Astrephomene gubernaculifera]
PPLEEEQQCRECMEAAERHGADRQALQGALGSMRGRNARVVFKVLCHAGPAGMKVTDIVRTAISRHYVDWPAGADRSASVHGTIRSYGNVMVHVGGHMYALTLFPGVREVPKEAGRKGARGGAGGAAAAGAEV